MNRPAHGQFANAASNLQAFPTAKKTKPSSNSTANGFALGIYRKHWMKVHFSTSLWACWADWMEADEEEAQTNGQLAKPE
ncbi:MAG TPA: hypothetical protein VHM93_05125 [Candidatus Acidoferrum sp.]|nr:hypothetical protein [Candidatus Acidoferrum sp.]